MTRAKKTSDPEAPRKRGRPRSSTSKGSTFQLRVDPAQRRPWHAAAVERVQSESDWAREGLDAWVMVCEHAAALDADPTALVTEALQDHARVRAAVAELSAARSLSTTEERLLRLLAPTSWARRNAS